MISIQEIEILLILRYIKKIMLNFITSFVTLYECNLEVLNVKFIFLRSIY